MHWGHHQLCAVLRVDVEAGCHAKSHNPNILSNRIYNTGRHNAADLGYNNLYPEDDLEHQASEVVEGLSLNRDPVHGRTHLKLITVLILYHLLTHSAHHLFLLYTALSAGFRYSSIVLLFRELSASFCIIQTVQMIDTPPRLSTSRTSIFQAATG